jgi:hypothetical protein
MYIILEINLDSYLEKSVYKNPEKVEYILIHKYLSTSKFNIYFINT